MNDDIGNIPAAELVRQVKARPYTVLPDDPAVQLQYRQETELIAQELDRRCEAAGISIADDQVFISEDEIGYVPHVYLYYPKVSAKEFHALLGWLLMKGGNP